MTMAVQKVFRPIRMVYLMYFFAACYLLLLLSFSQKDVFFSGDGGLKFMMIKQISVGEDFRYVSSTQPRWVGDIWAQGYFPLHPFVISSPKGYLFVFSPPFQIVNAFFYRHFGFDGLYIIPSLSLLLFWWWFIWLARRMRFSVRQVGVIFFVLAFCSPLTLYGAMYWEHTTGLLLLSAGSVMIAYPPRRPWQAAILGLLSGMAIWVRPEALLLNILFAIALLLSTITLARLLFIAGLCLSTASFLLFNWVEFGCFFGIHGGQILGDQHTMTSLGRIFNNVRSMNLLLLEYFPVIFLLVFVLFGWTKLKWSLPSWTAALLVIMLLFWFFSPYLYPDDGGKQWGPRFFMPLIPICLLVVMQAYRQWKAHIPGRYQQGLLLLLLLAGGYSFFLNTLMGAYVLRNDQLNRVRPALTFVKQDPGNVVVVNSHFVTQEMSSVFREKYFFLSEDTAKIKGLIKLLQLRGVDHFTYINQGPIPVGMQELLSGYCATLERRGGYLVSRVWLIAIFPAG